MVYLAMRGDSLLAMVRYEPVARDPRLAGQEVLGHASAAIALANSVFELRVVFRLGGRVYVATYDGNRLARLEDRVPGGERTLKMLQEAEKDDNLVAIVAEDWMGVIQDGFCIRVKDERICDPEDLSPYIVGHEPRELVKSARRLGANTVTVSAFRVGLAARWGRFLTLLAGFVLTQLLGPYGVSGTMAVGEVVDRKPRSRVELAAVLEAGRSIDRPEAWALFWCVTLPTDREKCRPRAWLEGSQVVFEFRYDGREWRLELPREKGLRVAAALAPMLEAGGELLEEALVYANENGWSPPKSAREVKRLIEVLRGRPRGLLALLAIAGHVTSYLDVFDRETVLRVLASSGPLAGRFLRDADLLTNVLLSLVPEAVGAGRDEAREALRRGVRVVAMPRGVFGPKVFDVGGRRVEALTLREALEGMKQTGALRLATA